MIKAIFLDIDGTLVSFKTHRIPQSAMDALRKAHDRGVALFIATGRPWVLIDNLSQMQDEGLVDGYVTMNGACCFDQDGTIYEQPMNPDDVCAMWDYSTRLGRTCIVVRRHDICLNMDSEALDRLFRRELGVSVPMPVLPRKEAILSEPVYQLTPFITEDEARKIASLMPDSAITRWHPEFVDVTRQSCSKQTGIDMVIRHRGILLSETMAIGDGGNDISMIRHAAVGVAMGNAATNDVRLAADYVTTDVDEDGIWNALTHYGII